MPVNHETTLNVVCDNPTCPGNDLDPAVMTGWLVITSEVYGLPTQSSVFCSTGCISTAAASHEELFTGPPPPPEVTPIETAPVEATKS